MCYRACEHLWSVHFLGDLSVRVHFLFPTKGHHINHHSSSASPVDQLVPIGKFSEVNADGRKPKILDAVLLSASDQEVVAKDHLCGQIGRKEQSQARQD